MEKYFVFTTPRYKEEEKKYGVEHVIRNFKEEISQEAYKPNIRLDFPNFPGNYSRPKNHIGNFRIILTSKEYNVGEGTLIRIYVALRVLKKGDNECYKFEKSLTPVVERDTITGLYNINWDQYLQYALEELDKQNVVIKEIKPNLNACEYNFISKPLSITHNLFENIVYETKDWVDEISRKDDAEFPFEEFTEAAKNISDYMYLTEEEGWGEVQTKNNVIIIYHKGANWVLCKLLPKGSDEKDNYKSKEPPIDFRRGYPFEYLERPDQWRLMEQDAKSNLVLSRDQIDVVAKDHQEYPMFITGRAGSGKSTMLQYLFAEMILRYLVCKPKDDEEEYLLPPVYLSYSKTLIADAEKLAVSLLDKNDSYHKVMESYGLEYRKDISPIKNNFFAVFSDLLIKCVRDHSLEKPQKLFPRSKYISFPTFKRKWNDKFGKNPEAKRKLGPSLCWHVIRTYIKGWNSKTIMTPEMYANECKSPSVSLNTYKLIYEKVWEKWYKPLAEDGNWDDQDIVRYCLKNGYTDEMFSAIYCDESQDFTRIELDFILNISSFSHRAVQSVDDIKKIPFVFAGDEFQTLNPTGFSWDSLRGYFVDRLFELTGLESQKDISNLPEPIEFHENFRSTRQIVKLANRIQLLRATRFDEYSKPQTPHFSIDGTPIYCVSPTENMSFWEAIKGHQVLMIAPIAEGEDVEDYINHSTLKGKIHFQNGIPQNIRIYSPAEAKGLEFANVVLYGFGLSDNSSDFQTENLMNWFNKPDENPERDIELKYQICNAYVAVTRATSRLYILDDFSPKSFWSFCFNYADDKNHSSNELLQKQMFEKLSTKQKDWLVTANSESPLLGGVLDGSKKKVTFDELTTKDSKEEIERMEQNAENQHDAYSFRQVATMYEERGDIKKAAECRAKALVEEENFPEAAKEYEKAESYGAALDCYWNTLNRAYNKRVISHISRLRKFFPEDVRAKWCVTLEQKSNMSSGDLKQLVVDVQQWMTERPDSETFAWRNMVEDVSSRITTAERHAAKDFDVIIENIAKLKAGSGINIDNGELAKAAYRSSAKKQAIILWDRIDSKMRPKEYYIAQYEESPYPRKITYAEGTGDTEWANNILEEYKKHKNIALNQTEKSILCKAVRITNNFDNFKELIPYMFSVASSVEDVQKLILEITKDGLTGINTNAINAVAMARFSDLSSWRRPTQLYLDPNADVLFNAIETVKEINTHSYQEGIGRELKSGRTIKDILQNLKIYARKPVTPLVFITLGKVFEGRGVYKDAVPYYEQVRSFSDDKMFETEMDIRWIVCKERWGKETDNETHIIEASEKRKDMNFLGKVFHEAPVISNTEWESLYNFALSISTELRSPEKRRPIIGENGLKKQAKINVTIKENDTKVKDNDKSKVKQEIRYQDYVLTYLPSKSTIVLKYSTEEDEYSVKIKNGIFPDSDEFELRDNRIYVSEKELKTPFAFTKSEQKVMITIKDDDKETGITMTFDID